MGEGLKRAVEAAKATGPRRAGKFGRLPTRRDARTLKFAELLAPQLAAPPDSFDIIPRVQAATGVHQINNLLPMDGNSRWGDCVAAAASHALTIWNAMDGHHRILGADKVIAQYLKLTGGRDTGLVELDTLNHWRQKGVLGERILAFTGIDTGNPTHIKQAVSTFGCVLVGFDVTDSTLDDFRAGRPWTPGDPNGEGHAVLITGYDADGVTCSTWGALTRATWDWVSGPDRNVGELWAVLPGEAILSGFAPGLSLAALKDALQAVAG